MKKQRLRTITLSCLIALVFIPGSLKAQEEESSEKLSFTFDKEKAFKPIVALEAWATYSVDEEKSSTTYANRQDVMMRRFRLGASGNPYSWLKYSFQLHADRLGEDGYAATKGSYSGVGLWNAYLTFKLLKNSDLLNLHAGYFWAAISRDYQTSPWAVGSFDKTRATWYLRSFVTGKGNGIESGLALGGIKNFENFGISYRVGAYEPDAFISSAYSDRLYTGRLMVSIGQPEETKYKYMLSGNHFGQRKGITIGVGGSTQKNGAVNSGDTLFFDKSNAYGADVVIDYGGLQIEGEYYIMNRESGDMDPYDGYQYHARIGYTMPVGNTFVEPVLLYEYYEGEGTKALFKNIGEDKTWDFGVNWYMNKDKLKLALHYVIQDGSASSNVGDFLGLACQVRL